MQPTRNTFYKQADAGHGRAYNINLLIVHENNVEQWLERKVLLSTSTFRSNQSALTLDCLALRCMSNFAFHRCIASTIIVKEMRAHGNILAPSGKKTGFARVQASSAHGIELFEDLLWDLATLSFVPHVFQPTLTFFPGGGGECSNGNGDKDGVGEGTQNLAEMTEASICAQLVSAIAPTAQK